MKKALWLALSACGLLGSQAAGVQPPRGPAQEKVYRHPDLYVPELTETLASLAPNVTTALAREAVVLGANSDSVFYDSRVGRWSSLILRHPLIPGHGDGNSLRWPNGLSPKGEAALHAEVWNALRAYLGSHEDVLRLDLSEISDAPRIASYRDGALIFVYAPRVVDGIPVRDNSIGAAVNSGNLILLGVQKWGDVDVSRAPAIEAPAAEGIVRSHAAPLQVHELVKVSHLELVPLSGPAGIRYRLAWVVTCRIEDDLGTWEGLVDAADGTLLAFEDKNQYADSKVVGGVYPVSNDHRPPDGNEQAGWPMPFVDFTVDGVKQYADTGGNLGCIPGSISTALNGLYLRMIDTCGAINEDGTGTIDLGFGPGALLTDCAVPSGHSAGDTKSSRSGYYELNRMAEQARGYLDGETDPGAIWVRSQLTAVMNINQPCNANWNGSTVNFFRSSPADGCRNTGEIAAIFDHEWGHGMDNNGINPNIAGPGEAVADIYAALRLNTSCIGRGFFTDKVCTGYGDACDGTPTTGCTGVRDIDYENHRCNQPHTISWILGGFSSGQCGGTGSAAACPALGSTGPCNRETHCEGMVMAETGWDLMTRDLLDPPFNYDSQTAHEIATRLLFFAAQGVGNWYTCSVGGGCSATGGYLSVLAADDDDGNLSNGTPHMTAIRASFERHEIHCATPAVANSGCEDAPVDAPLVTLVGQDRDIAVSWTAIALAESYVVYRGEGIDPCNFGKVIVAQTSELSFVDRGLANDREYSYAVMPVGANGACFGPQSACVTGQPVAGANFAFSGGTQLSGGDLDPFLDNCETATVSFSVTNIGTTPLTNVQVLSVTAVTHPLTEFLTTFPAAIAATLDSCETMEGSFQIVPQGLVFDGDSDFLVTIAADELGSDTRTRLIRLSHTESDLAPVTSQTFSFEADTDGWTTISGTFNRVTGAGGNGTNAHLSSSSNAHDRCDVTRSPLISLSDTSTLTMYVRYDIEPVDGGVHYDRANVSLVDASSGNRTVVRPSGGRLYNVPNGAPNGTCGTGSQPGWNGMSPTYPAFLLSTWTSAALNPGGSFTGDTVALQVNYGTDELVAGQGFDFDEVTLTNFSIQVPDAHSDDCALATLVEPTGIAVDEAGNGVLEVGEVAAVSPSWENIGLNAIDLTATITDFSGPLGPGTAYTVVDGTASYGTLVPGDSASCTDCYAVEVTTAVRPLTHWDALLTEVTPDLGARAAAFQKIWTLHVGSSFVDVPSSSGFYAAIETVLHNGVTAGCGDGTTFCPADTVTRQQMAVFLLKARDGAAYVPPDCTTPVFTDVPCSSPFAPWVNELAARSVTAGCGDGTTYCPTDPTNRQQMAVFLLKTQEGSSYVPPACTAQVFDDVPCSSPFSSWIYELVARNVTAGCGGGNYCPANQVARQQMAVFLTKTFGLLLYGA